MSRTFRRKDPRNDLYWLFLDYQRLPCDKFFSRVRIPRDSKEGRKLMARYHSDAYSNFGEPGPRWFRNLTTERPQRRHAKNELRKFLAKPEEYVVILNAKDPLEYWT